MRKNLTRAAAAEGITLVDSWTQTDASGDYTVDFSGKTFEANDLCLILVTSSAGDRHTLTGFSQEDSIDFLGADLAVLWSKVLAGTETTVSSSGGGFLDAICIVVAIFRLTSSVTGFVEDITSGTAPDPPQITSVASTDWVVCGGYRDTNYTATAPTNYTLIEAVGTTNSNSSAAMLAYRTGVSGTENPGAFSGQAGGSPFRWGFTLRLTKD